MENLKLQTYNQLIGWRLKMFNIKNDPYERVLLDRRENKFLIIKMKRMIRSYIEDQYMEPQKNLINIQALPSRHDGVWYPFE